MHRFGAVRRLVHGRVPVITFEKDRVCASRGCTTRLSMYNPDAFCSLHTGQAEARPYPER